jgi:hypothetical protein
MDSPSSCISAAFCEEKRKKTGTLRNTHTSVDLDEARTPVVFDRNVNPVGVDSNEATTPVVSVDLDEATTPVDLPIGVDLDEARTPVDVDLNEATTPVSLNTLKPFGVISFRYFTEPSTVIAPVMAKILIVAESTRDPEQGTNI